MLAISLHDFKGTSPPWLVYCSWTFPPTHLGAGTQPPFPWFSTEMHVVNMDVPTLKFTVPSTCEALGKKGSVTLKPGFVGCLGGKKYDQTV